LSPLATASLQAACSARTSTMAVPPQQFSYLSPNMALSHRRSLARCGERRWRRRVAGIPLVDPSRAFITQHRERSLAGRTAQAMRASLLASAIASMLRWSRASMRARSRATDRALPRSAAAPERRARPTRTVFSSTCCGNRRSTARPACPSRMELRHVMALRRAPRLGPS